MNLLNPAERLNVRETAKFLRISASTLYRYRKDNPTFPKPVTLSTQKILFVASDLNAWLNKTRVP